MKYQTQKHHSINIQSTKKNSTSEWLAHTHASILCFHGVTHHGRPLTTKRMLSYGKLARKRNDWKMMTATWDVSISQESETKRHQPRVIKHEKTRHDALCSMLAMYVRVCV